MAPKSSAATSWSSFWFHQLPIFFSQHGAWAPNHCMFFFVFLQLRLFFSWFRFLFPWFISTPLWLFQTPFSPIYLSITQHKYKNQNVLKLFKTNNISSLNCIKSMSDVSYQYYVRNLFLDYFPSSFTICQLKKLVYRETLGFRMFRGGREINITISLRNF